MNGRSRNGSVNAKTRPKNNADSVVNRDSTKIFRLYDCWAVFSNQSQQTARIIGKNWMIFALSTHAMDSSRSGHLNMNWFNQMRVRSSHAVISEIIGIVSGILCLTFFGSGRDQCTARIAHFAGLTFHACSICKPRCDWLWKPPFFHCNIKQLCNPWKGEGLLRPHPTGKWRRPAIHCFYSVLSVSTVVNNFSRLIFPAHWIVKNGVVPTPFIFGFL